ncbi:restriction endonuclease subunit S [Staphylococcus gallinarum]|uniref:restriction endonuclease subunit S n=1 Tax=Staphylococcus gallinarum TaxID=1293 RepID=UPI000D1DBCB5|nr:restriction endonuclease subunit S [Staphylococcus gallinarum]PTL06215.1 restriction endonuclease subunit S [Staphylococcus gallinarum]RIO76017.1 restriction endonuclease subunit S [Staphylococcus gallinarum]
MTNEIKNVPKLRFPEYSEEWEKKRLKDISKINPKLMNEFPSEFDYIDLESVYKGKINKVSRVTNENAPSRAQRVAQRGDVFFQTVRPYQQNNFVFLDDRYSTVVSTGYAQIRSNMNSFYIYNLLLTSTFLNKVLINCTGSNYPAINSNDLGNISIRISTNENEKQKIGEFFSKLDRQIELEEQKLAKLEEQKKGYMQKIFSQELLFKDEKGNDYPEWDITTIEKIAKVSKGFTPSTKDINLWQNDNKNWLSIAGMSDKYIYEGNKGISSAGEGKHKKVNEDTLIMSFKLTLGKLAIVKTPIYTNEAICHFEWKTDQIKTEYMYYYLSFINIESFGAQAVKGITLNNDSINSIVIKLPEFLEQNKISNFFTKFDELMEKQSQKIDGLKKRKKGFLQKMFV